MKSYIYLILLLFVLLSCSPYQEEQAYAEMLIQKVETFQKTHNRLPSSVSELGLIEEMNSPAFYELETDSNFTVWYGTSLGNSKVYRSSNKSWKEEG